MSVDLPVLPSETWQQILDEALDNFRLFDVSDPANFDRHQRRIWDRKYEDLMESVAQLRLVCRSWNEHLAYPKLYVGKEDPEPDLEAPSRRRVKWLCYHLPYSSDVNGSPSMFAPNATILSLDISGASNAVRGRTRDALLDDISTLGRLRALLLNGPINKLVSSSFLSSNFPNLVSLFINTVDRVEKGLSLPNLIILDVRILLAERHFPETSNILTWNFPRLRHLYFGEIIDSHSAAVVFEFLTVHIGSRLQTLEWDSGDTYFNMPAASLWERCSIETLITDLSQVAVVPPPPVSEGSTTLRRIVHTGSLCLTFWRDNTLLQWARAFTADVLCASPLAGPGSDGNTRRQEFEVMFTMYDWATVSAYADRTMPISGSYGVDSEDYEEFLVWVADLTVNGARLVIQDRNGMSWKDYLDAKQL